MSSFCFIELTVKKFLYVVLLYFIITAVTINFFFF